MRKYFFLFPFITISLFSFSQKKISSKKYNSVMWEITGNGLGKKAYLFGTMHVSNKLAFNLSDTFYNALKSVDAVAIENNPLTWQQEYNSSIFTRIGSLYSAATNTNTNNYISKNSFQFTELDNEYKVALAMDPEVINHFLYRSLSTAADFEEDTYLDMHIFQSGRKLGKRVFGLEDFKESEGLVLKAIKAEAGESKRKSKSTEADEEDVTKAKSLGEKIQDAYRIGDLDVLDSLSLKSFRSEGFNEYFLYARNKVHATEIDKILKKGMTLFAAVGAAHLPGKRGVIEMLRDKGYKLRPVFMGMQISKQKDEINKMKIATTFSKQYADDSLFSVDAPGKLYNFSYATNGQNKQWVHADFSNGAYYMVTRLSTHGLFWGKNADDINKKIDSLLYENIPGKILERTSITTNGYKGYNIVNKTRKGDLQRYNIFITPLELIVFKMSGFEEYVNGDEGKHFFNSIQFFKAQNSWQNFVPKQGGFSIKLPYTPVENNGNSSGAIDVYAMYTGSSSSAKGYEVYDEKSETYISILNKNIMNYDILEEDTFNLALANESLLSTSLFKEPTKRIQGKQNNIPYIEISGKCTDDNNYMNRIFLIGNNYYSVITKFKKINTTALEVLNSFTFLPLLKQTNNTYIDSLMFFKVTSSLAPDSLSNEFISIARLAKKTNELDLKTSKTEEPYWKNQDKFIFKNDTTHEEIIVESGSYPKYYSLKDSVAYWEKVFERVNTKTGGSNKNEYDDFYIKEKIYTEKEDQKIYDLVFADTNSTQIINAKFILNKGRIFSIHTFGNSITPMSPAKKEFFNTFTPLFDSSTNFSLTSPKGKIFFKDYFSKDSTVSKFARKNIDEVRFIEQDLNDITVAIKQLDAKDKDYFKDKVALIKEISNLKLDTSMPTVLNNLYLKAGDTATFQNACILGLANAKTQKSFQYLASIILNDPPVFESNDDVNSLFYDLKDTLQITKLIVPQLLPLASLDDYKWSVYNLLAKGVDSGIIKANDYETMFNKIYFDAKIELKKLLASDEKLLNKKNADVEETIVEDAEDRYDRNEYKNIYDLIAYGKMLMPFWDKNLNVQTYFSKFLNSKNTEAKLAAAILLSDNKKPVADSVWINIAKEEKRRVELFQYLEKSKKEYLIPANIAKQNIFCKSILQSGYNKKDSLVYLNTFLPATTKDKKGNVLFFKYKNGEKDVDWKIALCGLQPIDISKINVDETMNDFTDKVLKTNKSLKEQLEKILKEQLYSLRKSSSKFFDQNNYRGMYDRYND